MCLEMTLGRIVNKASTLFNIRSAAFSQSSGISSYFELKTNIFLLCLHSPTFLLFDCFIIQIVTISTMAF